jgi:hypothetical protein
LVAKSVRAAYTTEAFTWSSSALLAGVGVGLACGGALLEILPYRAALAAAGGTATVAALAVVVLRRKS